MPRAASLLSRRCVAALLLIAGIMPAAAQEPAAKPGLHITVPVVLTQASVVFNMDRLSFEGEQPAGFNFMRVMTEGFEKAGTKYSFVSISHGAAGYFLLNDEAYNRVRKTTTGNPYKSSILELQKRGVAFEECGETMKIQGWVNADLLPGVNVNTGANFRVVQLVQQGFVQIQP